MLWFLKLFNFSWSLSKLHSEQIVLFLKLGSYLLYLCFNSLFGDRTHSFFLAVPTNIFPGKKGFLLKTLFSKNFSIFQFLPDCLLLESILIEEVPGLRQTLVYSNFPIELGNVGRHELDLHGLLLEVGSEIDELILALKKLPMLLLIHG